MTRTSGVRPHHVALGYAVLAAVLGVVAVPLSGGYGLLVVTVPMLVVAGVTALAGLTGSAAPRAGMLLTVGVFLAMAGFFLAVERAYDPDGSRRESTLRDVGSALENHLFTHAPAALAIVHLALALTAAVLLTGARRRPGA